MQKYLPVGEEKSYCLVYELRLFLLPHCKIFLLVLSKNFYAIFCKFIMQILYVFA